MHYTHTIHHKPPLSHAVGGRAAVVQALPWPSLSHLHALHLEYEVVDDEGVGRTALALLRAENRLQ